MLEWQTLFNIAISLMGFILGFMVNRLFNKLDALTEQDAKLTHEIANIKVQLPTDYVTKHDLERMSSAIFNKLDNINAKLYEMRGENHEG